MFLKRIFILTVLLILFISITTETYGVIEVPGEVYSVYQPLFDPAILNHSFPEIANNDPVYTPIVHKAYFKAERALFDYYPRFEPGFVSFSPQGEAFLQYGAYIIETCDAQGQWTYIDLMPYIEDYTVNTVGYSTFTIAPGDRAIRFDNDGDAYVACVVQDIIGNRKALLLHSRDNLQTWTVYQHPYFMMRFEKLDGHNADCLNRPPVILMSIYITILEILAINQ